MKRQVCGRGANGQIGFSLLPPIQFTQLLFEVPLNCLIRA
jgi:hypothetical protein